MSRIALSLALCLHALLATAADPPGIDQKISAAALEHRYRLAVDAGQYSGPAWDLLLREGRAAQFFLLGEEHGIAENPQLAAALYGALVPAGYARLVIEISPSMATELDQAAAQGLPALTQLLTQPASQVAFFGMAEEAQMLVDVRAATRSAEPVLWGVDYEVLGDRHLIALLQAKSNPPAAQTALAELSEASTRSWQRHQETGGPQHIYSFAGDPTLVAKLRDAWPDADDQSDWIMHTLEETLAINQLWIAGNGWGSNQRRADLIRYNFLRHWRAERSAGPNPKLMAKMGASHLVRGRSNTEVYDLGALLPEVAAINGGHAFHLLVLPGTDSPVANFDPTTLSFAPAPAKDGYAGGLEPILSQAEADHYSLFDLRPLRPLLSRQRNGVSPELMRVVHGYDALLLMNGSTASSNLLPETPAWTVWVEDGKGNEPRLFVHPPSKHPLDSHYETLRALSWWNVSQQRGQADPEQRAIYAAENLSMKSLGSWERFTVHDLTHKTQPHRSIYLEDANGDFRILFAQFGNQAEYEPAPEIWQITGQSVLVYDARVDGTGNGSLRHYFVYDHASEQIRTLDMSVITKAIARNVPPGHSVWKGGGLDLKNLRYFHFLWREGDPNCCPSGGRIEMTLALRAGQLEVLSTNFVPPDPTP